MIQSSLFFCLIFIILKHTFIFYCKIKKIKISKWLLVSTFDFQNGAPATIIKKGNATNTHHLATILLWTTSSLVLQISDRMWNIQRLTAQTFQIDFFFHPFCSSSLLLSDGLVHMDLSRNDLVFLGFTHPNKKKKQQTHLKPRAANSWRVFLCQNSLICNQKTLHSM